MNYVLHIGTSLIYRSMDGQFLLVNEFTSKAYPIRSSNLTSSGALERESQYRPGTSGCQMLTWPKALTTPSWARMWLAITKSFSWGPRSFICENPLSREKFAKAERR